MAYNWAREEEWRRWKESEEKQLRELGVSEEFIKDLHPSLERFKSIRVVAELEVFRAVLDPAVVEHPCVMAFASYINSNHQCLFSGHLPR